MKTLEIIGYKRANLGKSDSKLLRLDGNVPCVLYGGKDQVHFHSPMSLFKSLVYTPVANMVDLNIEGTVYKCILQDIQFHPVSEVILHADFLLLDEKKEIKMNIPVKIEGVAPGVLKGGKIVNNIKHLSVKAFPKNMPDTIAVNVNGLDLGKSFRVSNLPQGDYTILTNAAVSLVTVEIPRALKGQTEEAAK